MLPIAGASGVALSSFQSIRRGFGDSWNLEWLAVLRLVRRFVAGPIVVRNDNFPLRFGADLAESPLAWALR